MIISPTLKHVKPTSREFDMLAPHIFWDMLTRELPTGRRFLFYTYRLSIWFSIHQWWCKGMFLVNCFFPCLVFLCQLFWLFKSFILSSQRWCNITLDIDFSLIPLKVRHPISVFYFHYILNICRRYTYCIEWVYLLI